MRQDWVDWRFSTNFSWAVMFVSQIFKYVHPQVNVVLHQHLLYEYIYIYFCLTALPSFHCIGSLFDVVVTNGNKMD